MDRPNISTLIVLAALGLALLSGNAVAQKKSLKDQLLGTWNIISVNNAQQADGKYDPSKANAAWGANPRGMLILTENGYFSLINTRSDRPKFASSNRLTGTADENQAAVRGTNAYFGTYTVDETNRTFTAHIVGSSFPNDEGNELTRPIIVLTADELVYLNPSPTIGGKPSQIIFERAK